MPYGNAPFAKELLEAVFVDRKATLGGALLQAKRRSINPKKGDLLRKELDDYAKIGYERDPDKLKLERIEHLYLYNLLGDPLMRLPHPELATIHAREQVAPGDEINVTVVAKTAGKYRIELVAERTPLVAPRRGDTDAAFKKAYDNANNWVRATTTGETKGGRFAAKLKIPDGIVAKTHDLRVWIEGPDGTALATRRLKIR
jgi:hypothetical protein